MSTPALVAIVSGLFLLAAFSQPLAARLKLPLAVVLALVGMTVSLLTAWAARFLAQVPGLSVLGDMAQMVQALPISSETFIVILLPVLLFQGAVGIDVRHLFRDGVAIILLAIVAVLMSVGMIGGAVHLFTSIGLTASLLLGAIVATTDPSAVIGIFRELGAPARLTRLVEGESLLNDATAIAIFNALLAALVIGTQPHLGDIGATLLIAFISGIALGMIAGHLLSVGLDHLRQFRSAQMTLILVTPYLVYAAASATPLVSGVVAVVSTGVTLGAVGRSRFSRQDFRFMRELLDQAADWSTGLIFVLAALLVPGLLGTIGWTDAWLIAVVILAALAARALTLWVLAPGLARLKLMRPISHGMNTALLWGGLRGAMTLALVLAVSENPGIAPETKRLIVILATGYTLFTLLIQGTSLRLVIRRLRLTELGRVEKAFRAQALQTSLERSRDGVETFARRAGISKDISSAVLAPFEERLGAMAGSAAFEAETTDIEKLRLALAALVNRERAILLDQRWSSGLPSPMIDLYLYMIDSMRDAAREDGRTGYLAAARRPYQPSRRFLLFARIHRWFGIERPLAAYLTRRYHFTLVNRTIARQLGWNVDFHLRPVFGDRICDILSEILNRRIDEIDRNIDAIRLQYPDFTHALERDMVERYAHHEEVGQIEDMQEAGIITRNVAASLVSEARALHREMGHTGHVDIEKPKPELLRQLRAFEGFPEGDLRKIAKRLRPVVFADNTVIYRPGQQIDVIYFIANGAVEIQREGEDPVRLGRGQAFGQLRHLNPSLKPATVRSISYSLCFAMKVKDFREILRDAPGWSNRMTSQDVSSMPDEKSGANSALKT